jgi:hypothetical protein
MRCWQHTKRFPWLEAPMQVDEPDGVKGMASADSEQLGNPINPLPKG